MDWSAFFTDVASSVVAGAIVLYVGYRLIDRKVHLRDALDRQREREEQNEHNRRSALEAVHDELESNAAKFPAFVEALREGRISYPLFDTTTLALAFEPAIFTTLQSATVRALLQVYNRMETANSQHALVFDLRHGPTVALTTMMHATAPDTPKSRQAADNFLEWRDVMSAALLQRCENLGPHLYKAIDAVEAEMGVKDAVPAAKRDYETPDPIGYVGWDGPSG